MDQHEKFDLEQIKTVPIAKLVTLSGLTIIGHGHTLSTKEHDSLKLFVNTNSFFWYSRGCGGTVIDWVMLTQNVDFARACEILSSHVGLTPLPARPRPEPVRPPALPPDLHLKLHAAMNQADINWWVDRGISLAAQAHFKLGVCDHYNYGKTYSIPVIENGLLVNIRLRMADAQRVKDKYRPYDTGRGTHLFNGDILTPEQTYIIVVAGELKVVGLWQAGFAAVSPTAGCNNWLPEWLAKLQYCKHVFLAFDPGEEQAALALAKQIGARARLVDCPDKPDDFLLTHSALAFRSLLRTSRRFGEARKELVSVTDNVLEALFAAPESITPQTSTNVPWRGQLLNI